MICFNGIAIPAGKVPILKQPGEVASYRADEAEIVTPGQR